jgi:hypothetical protein
MRAWGRLPSAICDADLQALVARVIAGEHDGIAGIERLLTEQGPTTQRLHAMLWTRAVRGHTPTGVIEAGRAALLREAGTALRSRGVRHLWLWGAGSHTAWVLAHRSELGLHIAGIVDDHLHGTRRHGFEIQHPSELDDSSDVLLSSDAHEDALWAASVSARARGVRVHRLYSGTRATVSAAWEAA